MTYLTSKNEKAVIEAEAMISSNCGFPNEYGTIKWADIQKAINEDLWFIEKPKGYNKFTPKQMMDSVDLSGIIESERDDNWFARIDY